MAGLGAPMQQGGAQPQGMAPHGQSMQQQPAGGAAPGQATEQEQAAYEEFAATLTDVLYPADTPGEVFPQILANLKGDFDPQVLGLFDGVEPPLTSSPQDTVAATSVLITLVVDKKMGLLEQALAAEEQGGSDDFSPEAVLMEGGKMAVEELIEVAEAAKIHEFAEDEVDGAFYRALDLFRVAQEKVNPKLVQSLQRGFEQIRMADQQGQLSKVLPGLPGGAPMQQQGA